MNKKDTENMKTMDKKDTENMKTMDKDMLETLAALEFAHEISEDVDGFSKDAARSLTTFCRLLREAGYEIPQGFDWNEHLSDE